MSLPPASGPGIHVPPATLRVGVVAPAWRVRHTPSSVPYTAPQPRPPVTSWSKFPSDLASTVIFLFRPHDAPVVESWGSDPTRIADYVAKTLAEESILVGIDPRLSGDLAAEDPALAGRLLARAAEAARAAGVSESGFRIVTNTGADGGQSVQHVHFHVLGGRGLTWPPG